jgi:hypothetical protein
MKCAFHRLDKIETSKSELHLTFENKKQDR